MYGGVARAQERRSFSVTPCCGTGARKPAQRKIGRGNSVVRSALPPLTHTHSTFVRLFPYPILQGAIGAAAAAVVPAAASDRLFKMANSFFLSARFGVRCNGVPFRAHGERGGFLFRSRVRLCPFADSWCLTVGIEGRVGPYHVS